MKLDLQYQKDRDVLIKVLAKLLMLFDRKKDGVVLELVELGRYLVEFFHDPQISTAGIEVIQERGEAREGGCN